MLVELRAGFEATFGSHGWWRDSRPLGRLQGVTDARRGLDLARSRLVELDGTYAGTGTIAKKKGALAHLLPAYDEHTVAYRDRSAILDEAHAPRAGRASSRPSW